MITQDDIDGFTAEPVRPLEYSEFVESMIVTKENLLGLCEEVGELHGKMKRMLRDNTFNREDILYECGDILFYTTSISNYFDSNLQQIMEINMSKLKDRAKRGVIKGSGDKR